MSAHLHGTPAGARDLAAGSAAWTFRYLPFDQRPRSDACWAVHRGPDGRVYMAACVEHTGGGSATLVRYDAARDALEYLFDVDEVTGDRRSSGRATQCKIHYSFVPDGETGLLYAATHLSGPPAGEDAYNPMTGWHDPRRAFMGSFLIAYDTRRDRVVSCELMIPREGCRCLLLDAERRRLYALTYPRDHLVVYDLERRKMRSLGRLGSVNSQTLVSDHRGRVYTFNDAGRMVRYDPETDRLRVLAHRYPHAPCQGPWHGVLYDAVQDPASGAIYMASWRSRARLARFDPRDGPEGRLEDLGPLTEDLWPKTRPVPLNLDHVGGLLFGDDGGLYYARSAWSARPPGDNPHAGEAAELGRAMLCRYDPGTGRHASLLALSGGPPPHHYVSSAACDGQGNLVLGKGCTRPAGIYRVQGPGLTGQAGERTWG